ncbi:hypothetical protein QA640_20520 [Bradyrhizobium sp. CB82]|nr:hypothetical protein [Bradyrhizobium sp. CB82]WFU44619.1 hypothetical protein QA640_20520 [Bradyrhizobium sp. CB82]
MKAAAAVPALSFPGILRAEEQTTLHFIPTIDLAFVDPIYSTAQVSRNHGFTVYDTLYGMSSSLEVSPQMLCGCDRCRHHQPAGPRHGHTGRNRRSHRRRHDASAPSAAIRSRRALVALANRANIDHVIVDGRVLVGDGRYLHRDEATIISAGAKAIGKIWDLPEAQTAFKG